MYDHPYTRELMGSEHVKDLAREMEHERQLALLPGNASAWRRSISQCGRLLIKVGSHLEGTTQRDGAVVANG